MVTVSVERAVQSPVEAGPKRRRGRATPKGRQVDPQALAEVRALLGDRPRRRDLLIEHLHLIQDAHRQLSAAHLAALAEEMNLPQAEVFEVATFYAHFDVTKEGETLPPVTVRVCDSLTCAMLGGERLRAELEAAFDPAEVRVIRAPCIGACHKGPACLVGARHVEPATVALVKALVADRSLAPIRPDYIPYTTYVAQGGYKLLREHFIDAGDELRPDGLMKDLLAGLESSGLRGLGGAGFPTFRKWGLVRGEPAPRFMCVNADEGEPGTFKDRFYLERDPHRFLEGVLIAAWSIEAQAVYIYLRDEYPAIRAILERELRLLEEQGLAKPGLIHLRRGAGAYICGEESAMIESLEGKRGLPRHRPPYVAQMGLFGRPTLVNNVETLFWIRDIVERGAEWFASQGRNGGKGLRSYSVSGRVREPGVKLAPAGITVRDLIEQYCGGIAEGHAFRAYLPGGASGGILPAGMADIPLDFGQLEKYGCFVGSHAVVILSDQDDLKAATLNLLRFFEDESCGQCTPCRVGTEKAVKLMERDIWDAELLGELARAMSDASICGLGQAASNPLKSLIRFFPEELGLPAVDRPAM